MLGVWSKRANVWTKSRFPSLKIIIETTTFTKSLIVLPSTNDIRSKKCFEKIMFLKKNSCSTGGTICEHKTDIRLSQELRKGRAAYSSGHPALGVGLMAHCTICNHQVNLPGCLITKGWYSDNHWYSS